MAEPNDLEIKTPINTSDTMRVIFKNTQPLELIDVSRALYAIADSYRDFVRESTGGEVEAKLFIQSVENGSMVVDMAAHAVVGGALLWQHASLYEWSEYFRDAVWYLTGKKDTPPKDLTQGDVEAFQNIVRPIAKDNGSVLIINATDGSNVEVVTNNYFVTSNDAEHLLDSPTPKEVALEEIAADSAFVVTGVKMRWSQANFEGKQTGNRARFDGITDRPVKVVFADPAIQADMFHASTASGAPWQDLIYVVDAEFELVNGEHKQATVLRIHPHGAIDPNPRLPYGD